MVFKNTHGCSLVDSSSLQPLALIPTSVTPQKSQRNIKRVWWYGSWIPTYKFRQTQ
jgi:hypothetical protein